MDHSGHGPWGQKHKPQTAISISRPYISLCPMDWKISQIFLWILHVDSVLSVCNRHYEWDVAAFKLSFETKSNCHHDVLKTGICKQVLWSFSFLEAYMTVNHFPVSGILKECHKIQHDSENMIKAIHRSIDHLLYCVSTWSAWLSHSGPEDNAVTATELYTVIPVRQLRSCKKLLRSPGPTEALIIEASFRVFVHLDFMIHSFEYACEWCILCFAFFPLQNKVQWLCKERKTKKCVRKWLWAWFFFLYDILQLAKCFRVSKEEQFMPVLFKMSQCAWIFLKIFCWLSVDSNSFSSNNQNYSHCVINELSRLRLGCLLHVSAKPADQGEKYPLFIWPLWLHQFLFLSFSGRRCRVKAVLVVLFF